MKKVTPIIKKERTIVEKYDVCPHCMQEIHEKSVYMDDNYLYHRPCFDKGPIEKIEPVSSKELSELLWGKHDG